MATNSVVILEPAIGRIEIKHIIDNPEYYRDQMVGGTPIVTFACKTCSENKNNYVRINIIPNLSAITLNVDKQKKPHTRNLNGGIESARCSQCSLDYYSL